MTTKSTLLSSEETARLLGVSLRSLARWHAIRKGPPRTRAGRKVYYRVEAIEAWLQANETLPLSTSTEANMGMREAALKYAANGWSVFPVHGMRNGRCTCGKLDCQNPGKHPAVPNGFHAATTDRSQIERWWEQDPELNIGIATGRVSGIFVVDLDISAPRTVSRA